MTRINPGRLSALLDQYSGSQKELAAAIGTNVGTLSRWKTGKIRSLRSDKLAGLCEALGVTPAEICAEGPLAETAGARGATRRDQISMVLDTACRNALALVARRYGVTRQQIVEVAPLLFTIMAEQSLKERREQLQELKEALGEIEGSAPRHLRNRLRASWDSDDQELLEAEESSIEQRDLFAVRVGHWDENSAKDNPFARFLNARLSETGLPKEGTVAWDDDDAPRYGVGIEELVDILGEDENARRLILDGKVALAEMPGDIRKATQDERAEWVKKEVNVLKATSELDPATLVNKAREPARKRRAPEKGDEDDF
ncbi:helix-turn-helix domain-containing protein [Aquicoccus porphyridii]|uniref:helix-turn-helix domain-containing protein n=1 Tax=Aquicoccus porphyridii TaxID=1852029 RepID=UPI00273E0BCF|nr:helix-turn-helix transcriptional regulator [Aquicoccus porphyridii]